MINVDGSFHPESDGGCGCIGRDHDGVPIFAGAGAISNASEALRIEAHALLQAISIAEQFAIGRPVFATDCQVLKQVVTSDSHDDAPLGALFKEVKVQLRLNFIDSRVIYMNRSCNKPAYELAALGGTESIGYQQVWAENYPIFVIRAMSSDYADQS
jgi:hypothetical protein